MTSPRISIIIPIYNSSAFMSKMLDSILAQTYKNYEVILIDDGSDDNSSEICEVYSKMDSRFFSYRKPNGGVSSARNLGIQKATGEWMYFVDSDDSLEQDALETLVTHIAPGIQYVIAGFRKYNEDGNLKTTTPPIVEKILSVKDALTEMYCPSYYDYQGYLWNKLLRTDIIKRAFLSFEDKIYFNEDRLFNVLYLCQCKQQIAYTTKPVYNYIIRTTSAMGSLKQVYNKKFATDFYACEIMYLSIYNHFNDIELIQLARKGLADSYGANLWLMRKHKFYDRNILYTMCKKLRKYKVYKIYCKSSIHLFIRSILLLISPRLLITIDLRN